MHNSAWSFRLKSGGLNGLLQGKVEGWRRSRDCEEYRDFDPPNVECCDDLLHSTGTTSQDSDNRYFSLQLEAPLFRYIHSCTYHR